MDANVIVFYCLIPFLVSITVGCVKGLEGKRDGSLVLALSSYRLVSLRLVFDIAKLVRLSSRRGKAVSKADQ